MVTTLRALSGRGSSVLERFPRHLSADDPDKMLAHVVDVFARELDGRSSEVQRIRRAHRLADAETVWDLLGHAALHDLRRQDFDLIDRRFEAVDLVSEVLLSAAGSPEAAAVRDVLTATLGTPAGIFPQWSNEPDLVAADQRLGNALRDLTRYARELVEYQVRTKLFAGLHQHGNGTAEVLLKATAGHIGLSLTGPIRHSADRFWHIVECRDEMQLLQPNEPSTDPEVPTAEATIIDPLADWLAVEDNPFRTYDIEPVERRHADRLVVSRSGWDERAVTIRIVGIGARTHRPMVVNLDSGVGVAYSGGVPDGAELLFDSVGQATLDGTPVTRDCYGFSGAVFADDDAQHIRDFVWADVDDPDLYDDRAGTWSKPEPYEEAFSRAAAYPHSAGLLTSPTLRVGDTRWAFFVGVGHFGTETETGTKLHALARFGAGVWDDAVFHPLDDDATMAPSGLLGFTWDQPEAFAARVWLPRRFAELDDALDGDGVALVSVAERVRLLLDRFRPAGVHIYVRYADERWILGEGILQDFETAEGLGVVVGGTGLWNDDIEQPGDEIGGA